MVMISSSKFPDSFKFAGIAPAFKGPLVNRFWNGKHHCDVFHIPFTSPELNVKPDLRCNFSSSFTPVEENISNFLLCFLLWKRVVFLQNNTLLRGFVKQDFYLQRRVF